MSRLLSRLTAGIAAGLLASAVSSGGRLAAHHAFAAEFDANKPVTLVGTLTKVAWVNPHGWIYVDVKGKDARVTSWAIEFGSPNALLRRGLRKADFPPGMTVTVKGYLAKSGKPVANASTVTLPDGRSLFAGSSTTPGGQP